MVSSEPGEALIRELIEKAQLTDFGVIGEFATEDLVMEWPQSGERFRGRDNVVAAVRAQPNKPAVAGPLRVVGSTDVWTLMMPLRYGDQIYHYVGVYELERGRIKRVTEYFGEPFPAQEYRAPWLDRENLRSP